MSVVSVLNAKGLYKSTGRMTAATLKTLVPTGEVRDHDMAEIDFADIQIFADELDIALKLENPIFQSLFEKNAESLVNLVRVVNTETMQGFKGFAGSGRQWRGCLEPGCAVCALIASEPP